ncbi:hypothetical protein BDZ94DRAFT_1172322 [Collybia nuda]|uniref:Cupredoxin n=1 Tax=Collybia nuda TaxID=64659 RepID=A0A9P6CB35_9AGAR|nr:hypothetical protein BDZ94DRAFT_1172322 [Collybia nuda]
MSCSHQCAFVKVVQVGSTANAPGGVYQFIPPSINATKGTTITFKYTGAPGNHSITQSTFSNPCNPMPGGFDSGNVLIPANNVSVSPEWNLTITDDSKPIWFFCKQLLPAIHCSSGMVGAINAPTSGTNTFQAYQQAASKVNGPSGQGEGALVGLGASASAFPAPLTDGAALFTNNPPVGAAASGSGTGSGAAPSASGNSTNAASFASVNTFLVFSAAALGVVLA